MVSDARLAQIVHRFQFLEARMAAGADPADIGALAREYSELKPVVDEIGTWHRLRAEIADAEAMLTDPDMKALAEDELPRLRARLPEVEEALNIALLPKDEADARPAILEIRPGTGGDE
ncbi:MAG: PCRF domain-containing protein, partial [Proteobacteria bacterium]|nr:PCRF domain-containing protein [Pseudomonadota bacterium]